MFYLSRQIGEGSNLENARIQEARCETKIRDGFSSGILSTCYLKDAIAPILCIKRSSTTSNTFSSKGVRLSLLTPCRQIQPPVVITFLLAKLPTKDFM